MDSDARAAAAAMWDGADYDRLAARLAPAADTVVARLGGDLAGPVIDLAAGTGSVATRLAQAGHQVHALDIAPGLVARGRAQTKELGLDVRWRVGSMDELDQADGSYAAVTSSFGLIFALDPVATLSGIARVLRPDGVLVAAVWEPSGYMASMSQAMATRYPAEQRGPATAWIRWGESSQRAAWLDQAGLTETHVEQHGLPWEFSSADAATEFLFTASPGHVAALRAAGPDSGALRRLVRDHLVDFAGLASPDRPVSIAATYQVVTARHA